VIKLHTPGTKAAFSHCTLQAALSYLERQKFNGVPERLSISNYISARSVGEWVASMQKEEGAGGRVLVGGKTADRLTRRSGGCGILFN